MATYRWVYESCHLRADRLETGIRSGPIARIEKHFGRDSSVLFCSDLVQNSKYLFILMLIFIILKHFQLLWPYCVHMKTKTVNDRRHSYSSNPRRIAVVSHSLP